MINKYIMLYFISHMRLCSAGIWVDFCEKSGFSLSLREVSVRIVSGTMQTIYDNCTYTKLKRINSLHIFSDVAYARLVYIADTYNTIIVSMIGTRGLSVMYIYTIILYYAY